MGECTERKDFVRDYGEDVAKVGDLLIEVVRETARKDRVYLLDEMYDKAIEILMEKAKDRADIETAIRAAVMLGMCRGNYLGRDFVDGLDRNLAYFYLDELNKRFVGRGGGKSEAES